MRKFILSLTLAVMLLGAFAVPAAAGSPKPCVMCRNGVCVPIRDCKPLGKTCIVVFLPWAPRVVCYP